MRLYTTDAWYHPKFSYGYAGKSQAHVLQSLNEYIHHYCEQQQITKDFIIPDIMTQDHPCRQRNGRYIKQTGICELKTMRVDSC